MPIDAKDVMKLRQQTGAGMMDCKKALSETNDDFEAAVKYLREKGIASAAKRAGRTANEGRVVVRINENHTSGAIVEVNSETDFVARNDEFIQLANRYADWSLANGGNAGAGHLIPADNFDLTALKELSGKIGEKLQITRGGYLSNANGYVDTYVHPGDQLGVVISISGSASGTGQAKQLAHDLALQIAAAGPQYIFREDVPAQVIQAEKEIYKVQMRNEGKPEAIVDKIATGKLNKFYEDTCLVDQIYVKDTKLKVKDIIAAAAKDAGGEIKVDAFLRFKVGETSPDASGESEPA